MCQTCIDLNPPRLSRRTMLSASLATLATASLPACAAKPSKPSVTPDQALQRLMDGHKAYMENKSSAGDYGAGRAGRATGQAPFSAVLSCADSRVLPELIFDAKPGEMFVLRVAGNVVNAEGTASLEYGTKVLGIPLIMVMGHSACGAVEAAIKVYRDKASLPGHLPGLVDLIIPGVKAAEATKPTDLLAASIVENVRHTVRTIATTEPLLAPMAKAGTIKVVGSVYDIATGKVTLV
ncbi:MAG: carbonic anhydrase [Acetobacteraceae bacterium]